MPTPSQIRAAIKTRLASVTDVGQVHEYFRYADTQADFRALFTYTPAGGEQQVRGWYIHQAAVKREAVIGRKTITTTWHIEGVMGVQDSEESARVFDDLLEAIADAFDADDDLGGLADTWVDEIAGIQVDSSVINAFFGVMVHAARLRLLTRHYE